MTKLVDLREPIGGGGGGGGTWGAITGTLSDQTDLQLALNAKANDADVVKLTGTQTVAGAKTFSDSLAVSTSGSSNIDVVSPLATDNKNLRFRTASTNRWTFRVDGGGDNLSLRRYDDSGVFIDAPLSADRSTGVVTINGSTMSAKEDVANKSTSTGLGTSNTLYPTQNAVKGYVDNAVSVRESTTNKSNANPLVSSSLLYPTTGAVKGYVDDGLALKENTANKSTSTSLGTSDTLFPTQNAVKTYVDTGLANKRIVSSRFTTVIVETDFMSTQVGTIDGMAMAAVSSGALQGSSGFLNHPGFVIFRDSTTINGGYRIQSELSAIRIGGGEVFEVVFYPRTVRAGFICFMGMFDSNTVGTAPTDCACFVLTANGTTVSARGRTRANNTATETSAQTLSIDTFYTARVEINSDATSCQFTIFNEDGTTLFTEALGNIPTAVGRETGFGLVAGETSTDAAGDLIGFDYMRFEINRALVR